MDADNLRSRVGDARFIGVGFLKDHKLVFNRLGTRRPGGVSSVEPSKRSCVYGAVWELNDDQLAVLDEIENPAAYKRCAIDIVLKDSGEVAACQIYIAYPIGVFQADQDYLELLIRAATRLNLPRHYLRRLKSFRVRAATD